MALTEQEQARLAKLRDLGDKTAEETAEMEELASREEKVEEKAEEGAE